MPSESITCASVAEQFAAVAGGESTLDRLAVQHVDTCLRCQAEQSQYRRLMKVMRDLRDAPLSGGFLLGVYGSVLLGAS